MSLKSRDKEIGIEDIRKEFAETTWAKLYTN